MRYGMILIVALSTVLGCQNLFSKDCTTEIRPTFIITVLDSKSGENLAPDATVWVRDDAFVDTLLAQPREGVYEDFWERTGTYEVVAAHPDYLTWRQTGVEVKANECHVITRELTARLTLEH